MAQQVNMMRSLVLSGGAGKGSWSAGAILHLLGNLRIQYDSYCGVSSGAINAAFLAMFPIGEEKRAAETLCDMWSSIRSKDVYKDWYLLGKIQSIWRNSFYNSDPMRKLIKSNISLDRIRASGKKVSVGAVSLTSGKYRVFTQDDDDFVDAVMASCAFPVIFEPIPMRGELFIDGGQKSITPISAAIDSGAEIIDVIITSPELRDKKFIENPSLIDIIARSFDLFTERIMTSDIEKALLYNRLAEYGATNKKPIQMNIIRPEHNLTDDLLDFDSTKIQDMIRLGYDKAKEKFGDNPV
jgi:NTE family protein